MKRLLSLLLFAPVAWAAPTISGVAGTLSDGENVVVSGAAFGSKATAAPWKYDTFEGGTLEADLSGWILYKNGTGAYPIYSNDFTRSGSTRSARANFPYDPNGYSSWFGLQSASDIPIIYIDSWYLYAPYNPPSRNHKLFRFYPGQWTGYPNLGFVVFCDSTAGDAIAAEGPAEGNTIKYTNWGWQNASRVWVHIQGYFETSSTTVDDGKAYLWIDCDTLATEDAFRTRDETYPAIWHSIWFGNYLGHSELGGCPASTGPSYTYWDNTYVDSTAARVEIGNASTYDNCTHREIQIPSAWAVAEITVMVNQGTFADSDSAYFYVTDSLGVVNTAGYGLTFGGDMPTWQGGITE